jgi:dolichyl-phosphate-mannose--protein O-mannosyl transferase
VLSILWGYDPDKCDYEPPAGQPRTYAPDCEYWKLRCIVAAFSAAACVLMFFVARRLGATVAGACLAALLEVFSVMHNVEGRLILLNSQLIFWLNASLLAGLAWFARANRAPRMALGERLRWAAGVGALCGNAVCIKHTGLATPGLLGVEAALGLFFLRQPLPLLDLLTFVASMAATYTLWFAIHIGTMIHSHATLRQEQEFMSPQYQSLLLGSPTYDPNAKWTEGFWWTFVTLNRRMVVHSAAITQPHAWGTRPWEWIFALRGVSYWCGAP